MPPFRNQEVKVDPNFNGNVLGTLRDIGHGRRINLVDRSYDIPEGTTILDYPGSTADALLGVVRLIPVEEDLVTIMNPDPDIDPDTAAYDAHRDFVALAVTLRAEDKPISLSPVFRRDEDEDSGASGFYALASNPNERHIYIRCMLEELPFACATLVAGHSQRTL